jgi:hypothetical protein
MDGAAGLPGSRALLSAIVAAVLLVAAAPRATAQGAGAPRDPGQKSVQIVRTDARPVIDGVLDEAAWANAALIDNLHQVNPVEYAQPSERTEIYLLYDDDALYIGARIYNKPGELTANVMRQNGSITQDDSLFVTIDPFNTRRGGYFFGLNAHGVRFDGLYRNVSEYYTDWDTIWFAGATQVEDGWIAEYEIPFKSISFDPNSDTWGLNFSRSLERRNEDMAWVSRNRRWDPSSAGLMTGLTGVNQGIGLDIVPSATFLSMKSNILRRMSRRLRRLLGSKRILRRDSLWPRLLRARALMKWNSPGSSSHSRSRTSPRMTIC